MPLRARLFELMCIGASIQCVVVYLKEFEHEQDIVQSTG
jgi:hypothetical protein